MSIIRQITYILLFYLIGEAVSIGLQLIHPLLFVPGTIIGMILLLIFLIKRWLPQSEVEQVGLFLSNNMAFFFIPAAVSVIEYVDILEVAFFQILVLIFVSTIVSFFSIVAVIKLIIWVQQIKDRKKVYHE